MFIALGIKYNIPIVLFIPYTNQNHSKMHKYKLASNKLPKIDCPKCHAIKHYQRYIDATTGEALPPEYGKCDNAVKCTYHLPPPILCYFVPTTELREITEKAVLIKQGANEQIIPKKAIFGQMSTGIYLAEFFIKNTNGKRTNQLNINYNEWDFKHFQSEGNITLITRNTPICKPNNVDFQKQPIVNIIDEVLLHTLKNYDTNTLVTILYSKFGTDVVNKVLHLYFVGTCDKYITFPFISILGHCRAISLIEYSKIGKRVKTEPQARNIHTYLSFAYTAKGEALPTWLLNYKNSVNKFNCLFGEHLMNQFKHKPIAIVEAPKTAIIASMFYPEYLWLACGGLGYLTANRIEVLKNRDVYLFPDNSVDDTAFILWNKKAIEFGFTCVNILEQLANDNNKIDGHDLADYILENSQIKVDTPIIKPLIQLPTPILENETKLKIAIPENNFHNQILELTEYFETAKLENKGEINLCSGTKIIDLVKFVDSHLETINTYYNKPIAIPYLQRLSKLKSILNNSL